MVLEVVEGRSMSSLDVVRRLSWTSLGHLWTSSDHLWTSLDVFGAIFGRRSLISYVVGCLCGNIWTSFDDFSGRRWIIFGEFSDHLRQFSDVFGAIFNFFGRRWTSLGHLWTALDVSGASLDVFG